MTAGSVAWAAIAAKQLVGRKIVACFYMTAEDAEAVGFHQRPIVLRLDDGNIIYPSRDDEGNDAGALFTNDPENGTIPVMTRETP